jgi:hypothetical protein
MNKKEILKAIMELPKGETNNSISTMNSINVNDLMSAIDRLNKVPTYDELLKENKKQKEVIDMFLEKVDKNKKLLNNPELLDLYLKIKEVSE